MRPSAKPQETTTTGTDVQCSVMSALQNVYLITSGDVFYNVYLEECQQVGDGQKRDPGENNIQTGTNTKD